MKWVSNDRRFLYSLNYNPTNQDFTRFHILYSEPSFENSEPHICYNLSHLGCILTSISATCLLKRLVYVPRIWPTFIQITCPAQLHSSLLARTCSALTAYITTTLCWYVTVILFESCLFRIKLIHLLVFRKLLYHIWVYSFPIVVFDGWHWFCNQHFLQLLHIFLIEAVISRWSFLPFICTYSYTRGS